MPRMFGAALVLSLACVAAARAQAPSSTAKASPSPQELTGCVSHDPGASGSFTFNDSASGGKYKLTGKSVRKYAGQMVRVVGGPQGKGLSIKGGLWPSPNVAAQAGALDPAQAAIAAQPGGGATGTGGTELPEFRVVSVKGVDGACK